MNIGLILPGFSADEADQAIPVQLALVRELARQDDVRVLALRYPHRRDVYPIHGAVVHSLGAGHWVRGWRRLALWWDALHMLRRLHRERPFDVLHAMWADECGLIAAWAGRWLGIPVVVSVAGGELVGFDDIGYGLQRSAFSRWVVGQALGGAARVIAPCTYTRDLITTARYAILPEKIRIIALGVSTDVFFPTDDPREPGRLLHVASLVGVKDQTVLLRALARLGGDVTLDIVGGGPERERLETLADSLGIGERVQFLGKVEHLALPTYYRRAALHVLCSRHEGQGMVTLEAAACGLPTVGTAVGLLAGGDVPGIAVPVGDDAALDAAIRELLADPRRREVLGQRARQAVCEGFTIRHTVAHLHQLYGELAH